MNHKNGRRFRAVISADAPIIILDFRITLSSLEKRNPFSVILSHQGTFNDHISCKLKTHAATIMMMCDDSFSTSHTWPQTVRKILTELD